MYALDLDADARGVLLYLVGTKLPSQRSAARIRETCHLTDARRWDEALRKLSDAQFVSDLGEGVFGLSPSGKQMAETLKAKPQAQKMETSSAKATATARSEKPAAAGDKALDDTKPAPPVADPTRTLELPKPLEETKHDTLDSRDSPIPHYAVHPLRFTEAIMPGKSKMSKALAASLASAGVRFLLAFESPKDALPVPVMDQDVLGRGRTTNIWIRHDMCISQHHCRFAVKRTKIGAYELFVEDLASKNGTEKNDRLLEPYKQVKLEHGDRLKVGNLVLVVTQVPY